MGWLARLFGRRDAGRVWVIEGDGDYECEAVGESHYQPALDQLAGGKTEEGHEIEALADLVPEPGNKHDRNAVMVRIDGLHVGYLSRDVAAAISHILKKHRYHSAQAEALIVGGWRTKRGQEGHYGVKLDIPI
jgi:hypothetical protein